MGCAIVKTTHMKRSEQFDALGRPEEAHMWRLREALPEQRQRELGYWREPVEDGQMFVCGPGVVLCGCGGWSEYLCDQPMGRGKTCDAPLCEECRTNIGEELDLCPVHAIRHKEKTRQQSLF